MIEVKKERGRQGKEDESQLRQKYHGYEEEGIENSEANEINGLGNYWMNGKAESKHVLVML